MAAKINGIGHITEIFYFLKMFFYPKSLVLCSKIVILLKHMVMTAIYIIIPGYYRILGNKCRFSLLNQI